MMSYLIRQFVAFTLIMSVVPISNAETVAEKNGVLGVGLDISESFTLSINGRLQEKSYSSKLKHSFNSGFNSLDQRASDDYRLDLSSFAAMIDWHPGESGFRLSAGLLHNGKESDNEMRSIAYPNYLIEQQGYTAAELAGLTDRIDSDSTAPYLGIGWRNKVDERGGFSFSAEAGLLFQGSSTSRLSSQSNLINDQNYLQEDGGLDGILDNVEIYPVLNLGISYTY